MTGHLMAETENSNPKIFAYLAKYRQWIVSYHPDPGILLTMETHRIALRQNRDASGRIVKQYWLLSDDIFRQIRVLLVETGYLEASSSGTPQTTSSYVVKSTPTPVVQTYSVAEIGKNLRTCVMTSFPVAIWIKGEISGLKPAAPHQFFDLVDTTDKTDGKLTQDKGRATLPAVIWGNMLDSFRQKLTQYSIPFQNGIEVRVLGKLSYYEARNTVRFIVQDIADTSEKGEFYRLKSDIEAQLIAQGIHDRNLNLCMPFLPLRLAVFSHSIAEGFNDLKRVLEASKFPFCVTLFQTRLQGKKIESTFLEAYRQLEAMGMDAFDLGVIVRGGGSLADLAGFNNLNIARTVALSPLKFIVGLGHAQDRCVLDEIALNGITPTDVGKKIVQIVEDVAQTLEHDVEELKRLSAFHLDKASQTLALITHRCIDVVREKKSAQETAMTSLAFELKSKAREPLQRRRLDMARLTAEVRNTAMQRRESELRALTSSVCDLRIHSILVAQRSHQELDRHRQQLAIACEHKIRDERTNLATSTVAMVEKSRASLETCRTVIQICADKIALLNPEKIMARGFVAVTDKSGKAVSKLDQIALKDELTLHMMGGRVHVHVDEIET